MENGSQRRSGYTYRGGYTYRAGCNYNYTYTYTYVYLYLNEKEIIKLLVNVLELFASFSCTRNWNRIPNTVPVPKSPNGYGSDRFRFRLRNPGALDW